MFESFRAFFAKMINSFRNVDKAREDWLNSPINPPQKFDDGSV